MNGIWGGQDIRFSLKGLTGETAGKMLGMLPQVSATVLSICCIGRYDSAWSARKVSRSSRAIALMEARSVGMVTAEEWTNLAHAVEAESGQKIEWRTHNELLDAEGQAT